MGCMREYDEKKKECPYCRYRKNARPEYTFALQPETVLQARYVVGRVLRCGTEELLYIGWDQVLDKRIAVKKYYSQSILNRENGSKQVELVDSESESIYREGRNQYISDAKELARFREETGIIRIYDYFEQNGTVYVITEYSDNYRREDIATRMLYIKEHKKRGRYIWRIVCSVELAACLAIFVCAGIIWWKPYVRYVSEDTVTELVPDVTGERYEQAKQELEAEGLQVQRETCATNAVEKDVVIRQSRMYGQT